MAGTFTLKDNEKVTLTLAFEDEAGNPASAPENVAPQWSVSDDTVATVSLSDDGLSATVEATGKLGTAQVSVNDANISGTLDIQVVSGDATQVVIQPGSAEHK